MTPRPSLRCWGRRTSKTYPRKRPKGQSLAEAFAWFRPIPRGTCLLWPAAVNSSCYGEFTWNGKHQYAHIVSYKLNRGPIPKGMKVDHICHVQRCINPQHLRLVTQKQNQENRRGARKDSKSGIRGVWKSGNKWKATVVHNGKQINVGRFDTKEMAGAAAARVRRQLYSHHNDGDGK